jgi:hypothetical protein
VVALVVLLLVVFHQARHTATAARKADTLIAAFEQAGLPAPSRDQVISVLGDDGGAVCANPNDALNTAIRNQLGSNGAAGPGQRVGPIASRTVRGEVLVLQTYCWTPSRPGRTSRSATPSSTS